MHFSGFADEAADAIAGQISATKALGWRWIEARRVGGPMIHDLDDAAFDAMRAALDAAGVGIDCIGSAIANWGKRIDQPDDASRGEVERSIRRARQLGSRQVRIMSYAVLPGGTAVDQMVDERVRRLADHCKRMRDAGLEPVHENCGNYGGMGWRFTFELCERIPELALCFDTGNPVFSDDWTRPDPRPRQSAWIFWRQVKSRVTRIHIKDACCAADGKPVYTMAGAGHGDVWRILHDALTTGWDGPISIEPHLGTVFHEPGTAAPADVRMANYVDYGRTVQAMVEGIRAGAR
jgi:sugar phosphate isomerase/epimerase